MRVLYQTFGCKANQYDTERFRQELEARGHDTTDRDGEPDLCVVNSCTVTNQADADTRRFVRRIRREFPSVRVIVAGCSAALRAEEYERLPEVTDVVPGHDPMALARSVQALGGGSTLVQLQPSREGPLERRMGATRGWLKIQDGCDRKCSFCATRLARGESRSRPPEEVVAEARVLARAHPELVITGIHIGHYGVDLDRPFSLARLVARLLDELPDVRFRLGSVEATEVDDLLLELLASSGGALAPHLHMPLQSGADPVLRAMRRWHTRETYRSRAIQIAERVPILGLGADVITGFPGETDHDHEQTVALVEELPFTYLHVFPFSPRDGTVAAELDRTAPVPQRIAGERGRELRERVREKGRAYEQRRIGGRARVVAEANGTTGLTGDYLRVRLVGAQGRGTGMLDGVLEGKAGHLTMDASRGRWSLSRGVE